MDHLTLFGLFPVTAMLIFYAQAFFEPMPMNPQEGAPIVPQQFR